MRVILKHKVPNNVVMFDIRNLSQGKLMNVNKGNSNQSGKKAKKLKRQGKLVYACNHIRKENKEAQKRGKLVYACNHIRKENKEAQKRGKLVYACNCVRKENKEAQKPGKLSYMCLIVLLQSIRQNHFLF